MYKLEVQIIVNAIVYHRQPYVVRLFLHAVCDL